MYPCMYSPAEARALADAIATADREVEVDD